MLTKILKSLLKIFFAFQYFQFGKVIKGHAQDSKNIVLVYPNKWRNMIQYFYSDALVSDLALTKAVIELKGDFRLKFGLHKMDGILDSQVFFNISGRFNKQGYRNYTQAILNFVDHMESQGSVTIPSKRDVEFWENKVFMHQEFERLNIKSPKTEIFDLHKDKSAPKLTFPFLIKEVHSKGAEGIYKINSTEELETVLIDKKIKQRNSHLLFQRLLSIDRDLRVVCIGDQVAYHHWRINDDVEEWEPTTYKKGKKGDFGNFPEKWRTHILSEFSKLNISTGGFDMAWENNDYDQSPYILEISPSYFPNPEPPSNIQMPYGDYKHKFKINDSWEKHYVLQAFKLKKMIVRENLNRLEDVELVNQVSNSSNGIEKNISK